MAGLGPVVYRYDRFDERLSPLPVRGEFSHVEDLAGEDVLTLVTTRQPRKGDVLLWDDAGTMRGSVVVRTERSLSGLCRVTADGALNELAGDFIEDVQPTNATTASVLATLLAPTRFDLGTWDELGTGSIVLYHTNCLDALWRVAATWGGEPYGTVEVGPDGSLVRKLHFVARRGAWRGLRIVEGRNLISCRRVVLEDEAPTALYGFGAGLPSVDDEGRWTGGFKRRVNFAELNGGRMWVGDESAREIWGRWNRDRTAKVHRFGQVDFPGCDDPARLLRLTRAALDAVERPRVSYVADVPALGRRLALGDEVLVVAPRGLGFVSRARVTRRERSLLPGATERLTLANEIPDYFRSSAEVASRIAAVELDAEVAGGGLDAVSERLQELPTASQVDETVRRAVEAITDLTEEEF